MKNTTEGNKLNGNGEYMHEYVVQCFTVSCALHWYCRATIQEGLVL